MHNTEHEPYLHRCLQLAALGAGNVRPNPMVGAVLAYEGRIIGEGYHQHYGQAHAEVNCFDSVSEEDRKFIPSSTLYVSLEPCAHYGKTPPCADRIIHERVAVVVVGCRDPFEAVNGKGIEKLRAAGIEVVTGILEKACIALNKRFFCFHTKHRPYIILKWAESGNHCISGKDLQPIKISGELTNRLVHRWRTEEAAIAVGTTTALIDNPQLTARLWTGMQPVRILLDKQLRVPRSQAIFGPESDTLVFNLLRSGKEGQVLYIQLKDDGNLVQQIVDYLYTAQIQSVIIEGGTKFLQSFIQLNCWDEIRKITNASLVIENGYPAPYIEKCRLSETQTLDGDLIQYFYPL